MLQDLQSAASEYGIASFPGSNLGMRLNMVVQLVNWSEERINEALDTTICGTESRNHSREGSFFCGKVYKHSFIRVLWLS